MPSWRDLKSFCGHDGWELYRTTDHFYFQKLMPDGTLKMTRVSMGSGEIPSRLWQQILKRQLQVDQEYLNRIK